MLTIDLDVFVMLPRTGSGLLTLAPIYQALRARGYPEEKECVNIEGVPVQFLPAHNPLLEEALKAAQDMPYEGTSTRVLRAEHLLAIALQTGRPKTASGSGSSKRRLWISTIWQTCSPATERKTLAALPFPEKVRAVVQLQRMVAPVLRARGKQVRVWDIAQLP